jgi:branched-chain amino acid transport system ATP-binding protein
MHDLLEVRGLSKAYGGLATNQDISFRLGAGERVALIGPNGAGKTTLVNMISGSAEPNAGRIFLAGEDITDFDITARVRRGLVRTFQTTRLFSRLSVIENISLAAMERLGISGRFFSRATELPEVRAIWQAQIDLLGISDIARATVIDLSPGRQRLVEIAVALALSPRVLLLDEPAAGVPQHELAMIGQAIDRLPTGIAILMIEQEVESVFRFARRVLVLAGGSLVFEGTPADLLVDPVVRGAYLGHAAAAEHIL